MAPLSTAIGVLWYARDNCTSGNEKFCQTSKGRDFRCFSLASGAVGGTVGQMGTGGHRCKGAERMLALMKSSKYTKEVYGFDECINYKDSHPLKKIGSSYCQDGVDIYWENAWRLIVLMLLCHYLMILRRIPV